MSRTFNLLFLSAILAGVASADRRPNVLFIVADDLNCAISPYGDPIAVTPHLTELAARGVTFRRAYCQQAVCNPSRSSFLTGLRPETVGVDDLRKGFRDTAPHGKDLVTLPQHFKNQGYFCQNIGKMFHNMGDQTHDPASWSVPELLHKGTHGDDTSFALTWTKNREGDNRPYKAPVTEALDIPDTVYRDGQISQHAAEMLRSYKAEKPFFLAVGFWRPHLPFVAPRKYWELYEADSIPAPPSSLPPKNSPEIAIHPSREIKGYGLVPQDRPFNDSEIQHYRHGYYASISFMDAQIGKLLSALQQGGHDKNTIIVFTSDHGFHIGEKSLWGKTSNFELDARVPLIVCDPSRPRTHGQSTESLAELIDLYPTIAELSQTQNRLSERIEGVSLTPILDDTSKTVQSAAFTRHQQPFYGTSKNWKAWGHSVRTDRWRFTQWRSIETGEVIARELYDHNNDPHETENVADSTQNREEIKRLEQLLTEN
ncbi:MAG: sulfatase [Pirellulaceae bacterium]